MNCTKSALVTGGGSGLGRATAIAFAEAGAAVAVVDVTIEGGEETAHLIEAVGGRAIFVRADISRGDEVADMVAKCVSEFGRLDWAFNNAGVALDTFPIAECDQAIWDRTIAINLTGVWLCVKHECAQMLRQGGGAIVNTSSVMGLVSTPGCSAYSASKAGVIGITRSVALDYATRGIRVNAICPGIIGQTTMTDHPRIQENLAAMTQMIPAERLGSPREIADTVVWMCSERASYLTGQTITVDGGYTSR